MLLNLLFGTAIAALLTLALLTVFHEALLCAAREDKWHFRMLVRLLVAAGSLGLAYLWSVSYPWYLWAQI